MDRLIVELKLTSQEAYTHLQKILEQVRGQAFLAQRCKFYQSVMIPLIVIQRKLCWVLQYEGKEFPMFFLPLCQIIVCFAVFFLYNAIMSLPSLCSRLYCWCFAGECSDGDSLYIPSARGARGEGAGAKGGDAQWKGSGLWLECWPGGSWWLPPLLFSRPRKCGVCKRHWWVGFQVRLFAKYHKVLQ